MRVIRKTTRKGCILYRSKRAYMRMTICAYPLRLTLVTHVGRRDGANDGERGRASSVAVTSISVRVLVEGLSITFESDDVWHGLIRLTHRRRLHPSPDDLPEYGPLSAACSI